ncbi:DUF4856 domain-containing protein [Hymenobacter lapidiphilus]|uniref:DUF4856 domain-containing protein n=1 Tax=Hymenobacter sp. CCM 8763 TaxID=2303334 RepID=UPI000E35222E|nr:DUF4856 domain-containing protein [Hymenobacter sp. CCM 8763]RFP65720.1 DUF4856 domain-containing protein [Hymenobacter sp. CCM 8763]
MRFSARLFTFASLALASAAFTACSDDKDIVTPAVPKYEVPVTYNFANVNYSGQQARLAMLGELDTYIKTANTGAVLDAQKLQNMYANTNNPFAATELNTAGKQLRDKTLSTVQAEYDGYLKDVATASLSGKLPAINGTAGILTSTDGTKKYLVNAKGVELGQLIQKGLMGAVFYYQTVDIYLSEEKIGNAVDNKTVKPGEGTAMEHHWDEAFGYFGAPVDFPTNVTGLKYWANYSNQVNPALKSNKTMMDALLKGRAAISNNDMAGKTEAAATLRTSWETLVASSAIHELNAAKGVVADQALKSHYLSEARGFVMGLRYKKDRKISDATYTQVMAKLGDNFYATTGTDINDALNLLSSAYGLDAIKGSI